MEGRPWMIDVVWLQVKRSRSHASTRKWIWCLEFRSAEWRRTSVIWSESMPRSRKWSSTKSSNLSDASLGILLLLIWVVDAYAIGGALLLVLLHVVFVGRKASAVVISSPKKEIQKTNKICNAYWSMIMFITMLLASKLSWSKCCCRWPMGFHKDIHGRSK